MKRDLFKSMLVVSASAALAVSCGTFNPGPIPETIVGDAPGELRAKLCDLMDVAGTDSTKVEYAEIGRAHV